MNRLKPHEKFLDLFFPPRCAICDTVLTTGSGHICDKCRTKLRPIKAPTCFKCGKEVLRDDIEYCADCRSHPGAFTAGKGIFLYDDRMKASMMKYKYSGCREYGRFFGRAMCVYGADSIRKWKPDLVVPVPMTQAKLRQRGFNQAGDLAKTVAVAMKLPLDTGLVRKIRHTDAQKEQDAAGRRRNLKGAFEITRRIEGKRILVIDDVYTTGSTMDEIAGCLKKSGAGAVFFLTLCSGIH